MSAGKSILGILAGAVVGAAIGILYAPDKGEETRKKISKKGRELSDEMESKFNHLSGIVHEKLDNFKREAGNKSNSKSERSEIVNEMSSPGATSHKATSKV